MEVSLRLLKHDHEGEEYKVNGLRVAGFWVSREDLRDTGYPLHLNIMSRTQTCTVVSYHLYRNESTDKCSKYSSRPPQEKSSEEFHHKCNTLPPSPSL